MPSKVSRLVTSVTEYQLAEKRKRIVVRCSVIEKISLSLRLPARSNREPFHDARMCGHVCKKKQPEAHPATLFYKQKRKKKDCRQNGRACECGISSLGTIGSLMKPI